MRGFGRFCLRCLTGDVTSNTLAVFGFRLACLAVVGSESSCCPGMTRPVGLLWSQRDNFSFWSSRFIQDVGSRAYEYYVWYDLVGFVLGCLAVRGISDPSAGTACCRVLIQREGRNQCCENLSDLLHHLGASYREGPED